MYRSRHVTTSSHVFIFLQHVGHWTFEQPDLLSRYLGCDRAMSNIDYCYWRVFQDSACGMVGVVRHNKIRHRFLHSLDKVYPSIDTGDSERGRFCDADNAIWRAECSMFGPRIQCAHNVRFLVWWYGGRNDDVHNYLEFLSTIIQGI